MLCRSSLALALALVALPIAGCAELALDELAKAITIETPPETVETETPTGTQRVEVPPPPPQLGDPNRTEVPDEVRRQSDSRVTPEMLSMASGMSGRLVRATSSARTFDEKVAAVRAYEFTSEEKETASVLGFRSISIDISGGGNSPYLVGGSLSQGIAFSLTGAGSPRWITGGGFTLGVPGAGGDLQIGFWTDDVNELNGWSMGVNVNVVGPQYVGATAGAFWSVGTRPRFQGFSFGPAVSKPGPGGDAGFAWSMYTSKIGEIGQDASNVFSADGTRYGAEIGESCNVGPDCRGYKSPVGRSDTGAACCNGTCQQTRKDYAGINWCPAVCKRTLFSPPGSCQ
ncbi:MAG: hypothetical protein AAGI52_02710 [Bacteroidota bacterium]